MVRSYFHNSFYKIRFKNIFHFLYLNNVPICYVFIIHHFIFFHLKKHLSLPLFEECICYIFPDCYLIHSYQYNLSAMTDMKGGRIFLIITLLPHENLSNVSTDHNKYRVFHNKVGHFQTSLLIKTGIWQRKKLL